MKRILYLALSVVLIGAGVLWIASSPTRLPEDALAGLTGDPARGEAVFWAGGCASCHMREGAEGEDQLILAGGQRFASPFGTFIAPNISQDPVQGIGGWTAQDLANAMLRGVSPEGTHYYPAFPYASYTRAEPQDVVDLHAFLTTLPASDTPSQPHEIGFPFNIRRSLGLWKMLFLDDAWVIGGDLTEAETRGRYLAEALTHCGECHTPRNALGGLQTDRWLAGAPDPSGRGTIPNVTPAKLTWSESDLVAYFTTGFTPEYDSVGGHMAHVVSNLARLPESDRQAIAAYLKKVPAVP